MIHLSEKTKEVLLTLFLLMGKIVGRTKLQKIVYLLQREQNISHGVNFEIYFYGPFSRDLNAEVDLLVREQMIVSEEGITRSGDRFFEYSISEKGRKEAMKIFDKMSKSDKEKIITHTSKFNNMTPTEIVKYVYSSYPDAKPPNR